MKKFTLRNLTTVALLVALEVVLDRFLSINTPLLKIGFGFVPIVVAAILFGPVASAVAYGLADLIGALLFPIGAYFPGFTLSCLLIGLAYGLFLYHAKVCTKAVFFGKVLPAALINALLGLILNSLWLTFFFTSTRTYPQMLLYRLPEYAVLLPLNLVMIPLLMKVCEKLKVSRV